MSKKLTFSNTVTETDLETYCNVVKMKTHDGLSDISKKYENLVWLFITNQYNTFLRYVYGLYTDELEICLQNVIELLKRILNTGKSPILNGGGGRNRILGLNYKNSLYSLIIQLQSIIRFRTNCILTLEPFSFNYVNVSF